MAEKKEKVEKPTFLLPSGKTTTSKIIHKGAWERLAFPLCKVLGGDLAAYDPGLLIYLTKEQRMIRMDVDVAIKIVKALKKPVELYNGEEV